MAHPSSSVKVVEVCKVAPQPSSPELDHSPTPPAPESLPLTLFDLLWLRFAPVQRLFFYETSDSFETAFFDKLKTSLSITLQHFLPLAGNLTWPQDHKPVLTYVKGDAVSLTIARSDADNFYHLSSRNDIVEAEEYHPLTPELPVSRERAAAMAFQVTIFPNRGFCIGTSMHHAILDGKTSTMFVKSWAHICKHESNLLPDQLKPFYDRSVIQDPAGLESTFLNQLLNIEGPNNRSLTVTQYKSPPPDPVRGTFVFTRAKIEALKQLVKQKEHQQQQQQQHDQYQSVHLSTFSLTFAYTWVCFLKAGKIQPQTSVMGFTVDCRSRLDPPVPGNYLGNCMSARVGAVETKTLVGEDGLVVAVNAISEAIKSSDTAGVLNGAETWIPILYPVVSSDEKLFSVAGSPRFRIYDTDFGWGRPSKVEIVSIEGTGAMSLSESRDGDGGVEVGLVLNKHHMQAFASLFAQGIQDL